MSIAPFPNEIVAAMDANRPTHDRRVSRPGDVDTSPSSCSMWFITI
jgi:hypothetical protein